MSAVTGCISFPWATATSDDGQQADSPGSDRTRTASTSRLPRLPVLGAKDPRPTPRRRLYAYATSTWLILEAR